MTAKILRHRSIAALCLIALILVLGGALWAFFGLQAIGHGPFILHFNDIEGITQVGGVSPIVWMGILGVIIVVGDFFIALELAERERFPGELTAWLTFAFAVLLFIAFAAILSVN